MITLNDLRLVQGDTAKFPTSRPCECGGAVRTERRSLEHSGWSEGCGRCDEGVVYSGTAHLKRRVLLRLISGNWNQEPRPSAA